MSLTILILTDNPDKQASGLAKAFRRRGCEALTVSLAAIAFDSRAPDGLAIPDFGAGLPDAVVVRSIAAGSFEAITRRLGVLHALGRLGVPVWNSAQAIERCVDKSMTTFLLQREGLPTPPTFAVEGPAEARQVAARELPAGPLVTKPLFGAQGRGIRLIRAPDDLPPPEEVAGVYYLQRYVMRPGPPFRDYRVLVCAGRAIATMVRRGEDWITNISRGGVPEPGGEYPAELESLAVAAAGAVGADFAGVDIIPAEDGTLQLLEVNSMPAWSGLQSVASVSIADEIAGELLRFIEDKHRAPAALRVVSAGG